MGKLSELQQTDRHRQRQYPFGLKGQGVKMEEQTHLDIYTYMYRPYKYSQVPL